MSKIAWNKYETALLIDSYCSVIEKKVERAEEVRRLSTILRHIAIDSGLNIDNVFRNTNGISLRMAEIHQLFVGGGGVKNTSALFKDMVLLYKHNYEEYEKILTEAKQMVDRSVNCKDAFYTWLLSAYTKEQASEFILLLAECESFCRASKQLFCPLFETTDLSVIYTVRQAVEKNKMFRAKARKNYRKCVVAIRQYYRYVKYFYADESVSEIDEIEDGIAEEFVDETVDAATELDRDDNGVAFTDHDNEIEKQYPIVYKRLYNLLLQFEGGYFSTQVILSKMDNITSETVLCNIMNAVSWCENIDGKYGFTRDKKTQLQPEPDVCYDRLDPVQQEKLFFEWLRDIVAERTCNSYSSAIRSLGFFVLDKKLSERRLYEIGDIETLQTVVNKLFENTDFVTLNASQHNRFSAALQKYMSFVGGEIVIPKEKNTTPAAIVVEDNLREEIEALLLGAKEGLTIVEIKEVYPNHKQGRLYEVLSNEFALLVLGKYYHINNISDYSEMADILLETLQKQFLYGGGYTSAKQLYEDVKVRLDDFFFYNDGFESRAEVYDIAKSLFEKTGYKNNKFVFYNNMHIWESEPNYPKDHLGLIYHWAKMNNGIISRDEIIERLEAIGCGNPAASFSNIIFGNGANVLWQYSEYKFVLSEAVKVNAEFLSKLKLQIERLLEGDDYISLGEIDDYFYSTLPDLPVGTEWSPMLLKDILHCHDIGFKTIPSTGDKDLKTIDAALVRKDSQYQAFSDIVWADINDEYALPVEMTAEELREFLLNKGYIRGMEKMYSVHKTVEDDLRFFWTDGNERVTISKK